MGSWQCGVKLTGEPSCVIAERTHRPGRRFPYAKYRRLCCQQVLCDCSARFRRRPSRYFSLLRECVLCCWRCPYEHDVVVSAPKTLYFHIYLTNDLLSGLALRLADRLRCSSPSSFGRPISLLFLLGPYALGSTHPTACSTLDPTSKTLSRIRC